MYEFVTINYVSHQNSGLSFRVQSYEGRSTNTRLLNQRSTCSADAGATIGTPASACISDTDTVASECLCGAFLALTRDSWCKEFSTLKQLKDW